METFLLVVHIILSFVIVVVILLQSGQGGGMGAGFGGAAAVGQEIFGGRGAATFLGKLTALLGAAFMITSMALAWYSSKPQSVLDLTQGGSATSQAQVHQVLEEGTGEFRPTNTQGAPGMEMIQDGDIPEDILRQLQEQMEGQGQEFNFDAIPQGDATIEIGGEDAGAEPSELEE